MALKFKLVLFLVGVFIFFGAANVSFAACYWGCDHEVLSCLGKDSNGDDSNCDWVCSNKELICIDPEHGSEICNQAGGFSCTDKEYKCLDTWGKGTDCDWRCKGSGPACDDGGGGGNSCIPDGGGCVGQPGSACCSGICEVRDREGEERDDTCVSQTTPTLTPTPPPPPPPPPSSSNVSVTQPNYCTSGPAAATDWTYSDPSGSAQSAYQVQIDDQGSFNSPEWDSGKVVCSGCRSNSTPQGYLVFNTIYRTRVRVWNGYDVASGWTESSTWKTPNHAYPQTDLSFAGAIPGQQNLIPDSPIQFTDQSTCYNNQQDPETCDSWLWNFNDSTTSTQQNPQHTYSQTNTYNVNLRATDDSGNSCSITKPVNVQELNPIWKEVNPGG